MAPPVSGSRVRGVYAAGNFAIGAFDGRISRQVDAILHHPTFQHLERAWRGLAFVVERTDFAENIQIALLNCTMGELRTDFERSRTVERSALYQLVYSAPFGDVAGEPYGAISSSNR